MNVDRERIEFEVVEQDRVSDDVNLAVETKTANRQVESVYQGVVRIELVHATAGRGKIDPQVTKSFVVGDDHRLQTPVGVLEHHLERVVVVLGEPVSLARGLL